MQREVYNVHSQREINYLLVRFLLLNCMLIHGSCLRITFAIYKTDRISGDGLDFAKCYFRQVPKIDGAADAPKTRKNFWVQRVALTGIEPVFKP